jgi:hypothetical protein
MKLSEEKLIELEELGRTFFLQNRHVPIHNGITPAEKAAFAEISSGLAAQVMDLFEEAEQEEMEEEAVKQEVRDYVLSREYEEEL